MPNYITEHHGGGWKYQLHIPIKLRSMLGRTAFVRYLKRMPRREAEALARAYALEDAAKLAAYQAVPEHVWAGMAEAGGLLPILNNPDIPTSLLDERYAKLQKPELFWRKLQAEAIQTRVDKKVGKPSPEHALSWDGLFEEWKRIRAPIRHRHYAATIRLLKDYFGERDCRQITQLDIGKFRDSLTVPRARIATHLTLIHAMFAAVANEPTSPFAGMVNPCAGVKVLGKNPPPKDGSDRRFSPSQVCTVLETTERVKFGGKRHTEISWALRLLAFTGARPNEIFQFQGGDVCEQDGVKFLRIQQTDPATGKRHPEKSVKTGEARVVPLHPEVMGFFEYAAKFNKGNFIFDTFKWNKDNGRASWLISEFPTFLKSDCQIREPLKRLTLYSLRHSFVSAMRTARVPEDIQKQIVGHGKDVHARYGGGELKLLAEEMAKVKPLG